MKCHITFFLYFYLIYKGCVTISWFGSSDSNRPYDVIDQIHSKIEDPEVFVNILKFLENNNDNKDQVDGYSIANKDSLERISNYLGKDIARIVAHIAHMASLHSAKSKDYEDFNLTVNSNAILDHIAGVLESQTQGFDYDKIKESIYKWASFYLADDENRKSIKNDKSSGRVSYS